MVERLEARRDACAEERNLDKSVLCARCENGTVIQRRGVLDLIVYCHSLRKNVPGDIVRCTSYQKVGEPSMHDLEERALKIDPRKGINDRSYL